MFHRSKRSEWSLENEGSFYKVYDSAKRLAGYFFPDYDTIEQYNKNQIGSNKGHEEKLDEDSIIKLMNKRHVMVEGGNLMLPMIKLDLLDNEAGMAVNEVINALDRSIRTADTWKNWLFQNSNALGIVGSLVYTAREDRNMLSILLAIKGQLILGEKEALNSIAPILNKLHEDGLL